MWATSLLTLVLCTGCGGDLVQLNGRVILDGKPLEKATVTFTHVHDTEEGGRLASGFTDEAGYFRLTTFERDDGIIPGQYKVTVLKVTTNDPTDLDSEQPDSVLHKIHAATSPLSAYFANVKNVLPEVYGDYKTTPLSCDVDSKLRNVEFELDSNLAFENDNSS